MNEVPEKKSFQRSLPKNITPSKGTMFPVLAIAAVVTFLSVALFSGTINP